MLHFVFCLSLWSIVGEVIVWKVLQGVNQGVNYAKKIHQIPCADCIYFTGDHRLKCTVDPIVLNNSVAFK